MKIAPLKASDPWFARISSDTTIHTDTLSAVPIEATVEVELVELLHEGPEANYRPYLHLRGELSEVKPVVELPYGVSELALRHGSGLPLDAFYAFDQEQLTRLVSRGYFTSAFRVPQEMSGIPWTLPGKADFMVVAPEYADQAPIVFMTVHDQTGMELDEANSGYELSAYFPDYSAEAVTSAEHTAEDMPLTLEGEGNARDVFSDITFNQPVAQSTIEVDESEPYRAIVPDGVFSRLVEEIEARQKPAPVAVVEADIEAEEPAPTSFEAVYLERVDPGVARVLSGEHVAESADEQHDAIEVTAEAAAADVVETEREEVVAITADGFLDLSDDEPEIESLDLHLRQEADEQRAAAERRAARLRAEASAQGEADGDDAQITL